MSEITPDNNGDRDPVGSELRLLVTSTLQAITLGVIDAAATTQRRTPSGKISHEFLNPEKVEFDVAVSAKRVGGVGGGLKLEVFSVGASAKGERTAEHSTVSRIKFAVPYTAHWMVGE